MASMSDIIVKKELRLCKIGKELGYFHCWEQYGDVIFPGIMVGSNPDEQYSQVFGTVEFDDRIERVDQTQGGQYSRVFGIVEFDNRIERVDPTKIQFIDETHNYLHAKKEYLGSFKKAGVKGEKNA